MLAEDSAKPNESVRPTAIPKHDGFSGWSSHYPFASHFLDVPAGRLHYIDEGAGEPLVMVHGNPTWSFFYRHLITGLRGQNRCLALDHMGCGFSDKPVDFSYRLADHVANLERFLVALDLQNVTLVVHDWGGAIGMGAALRQKERIKRLVILNTAAFPADRMPWRIKVCRTPVLGPLAVRGANLFVRAALRMAMGDPRRMTRNNAKGYVLPYDSWKNRIAIQKFVEDIPMDSSHPSYHQLEEIGKGLQSFSSLPVFIAWGMKDFCFTPWFLEKWKSVFPDAEVHQYAKAGHYLLEEEGEDIRRKLRRFLNRNP